MRCIFVATMISGLAAIADASAQNAASVPPFAGTISRIPGGVTGTRQGPGTTARTAMAVSPSEVPNFDLYTKDSVTFGNETLSPAISLGYKNLRSATHPWTIDVGYKNVDSSSDRLDLWLGSGWVSVWSHGTDTEGQSLTFEEDASVLRGIQTRFDTYGIGEVVKAALTVDLLAGVTTAQSPGSPRLTDFLVGVLPSLQLSDHYSIQGFYSFKNDIDGEDYFEGGVARAFGSRTRLAFIVAKHGTCAVRFQRTLARFYRPIRTDRQ